MEIKCKFCGSEKIVKKGLKRLKKVNKQMYSYKNCNKRFSLGNSKKKFNAKVVIGAVCVYNQGYNLDEVCDLIGRRYKVVVSRNSVLNWCKEYSLGYLDIRDRMVGKYGSDLIIGLIILFILQVLFYCGLWKRKVKEEVFTL